MSKLFRLIFTLLLAVFLLAGCNILTSQPAPENEKELESQEVVPFSEESAVPLTSSTAEPLEAAPETTEPLETASETAPVPENETSGIGEEQTPVISTENLDKLQIVRETTVEYPYRIKWFNNGSRLGVIVDQNLLFLDGETLESIGSVEIETPYILLDFSSADDLMAVTKDRTNLELRNTQTGELVREIIPPVQILGGLFSPDGKYLAANTIDDLSVILWDVESGGGFIKP